MRGGDGECRVRVLSVIRMLAIGQSPTGPVQDEEGARESDFYFETRTSYSHACGDDQVPHTGKDT